MATFYLTEIAKGDKAISGAGIYTYQDTKRDEAWRKAVASFHKKMGTAMSSDLYDSELLYIVDDNGTMLMSERYDRPVSAE